MNILRRRSRGTKIADHENRIQTLEKRVPSELPFMYGEILGAVNAQNAGNYAFDWAFGSPCSGDPTECEDQFVTDGEYLLLPVGWDGPFRVYMEATVTGGDSNLGNYRTVVDAGDIDQHGKSHITYLCEIWRDNAPFGFELYRGWSAFGEHPPPQGISVGFDRRWWYYAIQPALSAMDASRDRFALWPYFDLGENLAGAVTVDGLSFVVELIQNDTQLPGVG